MTGHRFNSFISAPFQLHITPHVTPHGSQGTAIAAWACIAVGISSPSTATHGRMHARTPSTPAWLGLGLGLGLGVGLGVGLGLGLGLGLGFGIGSGLLG